MYAHLWHSKPRSAAVVPPGLPRDSTAIMSMVFLLHSCVQHLAPQRGVWHNVPSVPSCVLCLLLLTTVTNNARNVAVAVGALGWWSSFRHFQEGILCSLRCLHAQVEVV